MSSETFRFSVGDFKCIAISDGTFRYPVAMFFANVSKEQYEPALRQRGLSLEQIEVPYTCLYIDTGRERVLVDTGAGDLAPTAGKLLPRLHAEGIEPPDIGTVILSHAHPDHIGGNLDDHGKPAFPNARYIIWKQEWDFWLSSPNLAELQVDQHLKRIMLASAEKNLSGIEGQIELLKQETEVLPGVLAIPAPGHTPGHMALKISSNDAHLLYLADAVCHPLHLEYPETCLATDLLPMQVLSSRRQLLRRATRETALVHAFHFPFPGLGHVTAKGAAWHWRPFAAES